MWSTVTKGSEVVGRLRMLIDELSSRRELTEETKDWMDLDDILRFWARHTSGLLQAEFVGVSLNDLLFLLLCHIVVRLDPNAKQQPQKEGILELTDRVRCLSIPVPDCKQLPDAALTFNQCAEALIVHKSWTPDQAWTNSDKTRARAFGLDLGTEDDVYDGEEMEQRQGEEEKRELGEARESEMQARKRSRFLRWCSRGFLDLWYVERILLGGQRESIVNDRQAHDAVFQWRDKFAAWCERQCRLEQPRAFRVCIETWSTRLLTGLGAQRQKPKRDFAAAFTADATETKFVPKTLAKDAPQIIKDTTHPFSGIFRLALAIVMFDCLAPNDDFASQFLVLRDELLEKTEWITATETDRMLPRRPVIVQWGQGKWSVHNKDRWTGAWDSPTDALLVWAFLVQRDFDGQTVVGSRLDKWLKTIVGGS
jgi:hypothetical protein